MGIIEEILGLTVGVVLGVILFILAVGFILS